MKTCLNCGFNNEDNAKFCKKCGKELLIKDSKQFCKECGTPIIPGAKFCKECGTLLNSVPETIQKEEKKIKLEPKKEEAIPQTLETSKDNNLTKEQPQDHSSNGFYGGLVAIAVIIIIGGACMLIEYEKEASFGDNQILNESDDTSYDFSEPTDLYEEVDDTDENTYDSSDSDEESEIPERSEEFVDEEYIIPESDEEYLTEADVAGLSLREINYAKNEIYARHGRRFRSRELTDYFSSQSWYRGLYDPDDFDANYGDGMLNDYERKNAELLSRIEFTMAPNGYELDN